MLLNIKRLQAVEEMVMVFRNLKTLRCVRFALVILFAVVVWTESAEAQRSSRYLYRTSITLKDLDSMSEILGTTEDQDKLVRSLYDGYQMAFGEGVKETKSQLNELYAGLRSKDQSELAEARKNMTEERSKIEREWGERVERLEATFFEDVKSVLTDEQQSHWDEYEQERRRRTMLKGGGVRTGAESIDLIRLVEEQELTEKDYKQIDVLLESYADELDRALLDRQEILDRLSTNNPDGSQVTDSEERLRLREDLEDRRKAVRELNERYAQLIADQMPVDAGEVFHRTYVERCYPSIYRTTMAESYISKVLKLSDLTEDQQKTIESIQQEFLEQSDAIRSELVELQAARESQSSPTPLTRNRGGGMTRTPSPHQSDGGWDESQRKRWSQLWQEHRELESSTIDRVFDELTEEQQNKAPKGGRRTPG